MFFEKNNMFLSLSLEMKYALNNVAVRLLNLTWAKFYGKLKSGYNVLADYFCARQQGEITFTALFLNLPFSPEILDSLWF